MKKVTPFPRQIELGGSNIEKLNAIADSLDALAEAVHLHATEIRRHAAELEAGEPKKKRGPRPS